MEEVNMQEVNEDVKAKRQREFDQRMAEQRMLTLNVKDKMYKKSNVRSIANSMMKASTTIASKAFDILQMDNDGVVDISAILIELDNDNFKIRYVYDD